MNKTVQFTFCIYKNDLHERVGGFMVVTVKNDRSA